MDWSVDDDEIRPLLPQPFGAGRATVRGTVVDDPEDSAGGPIRILTHDLGDKPVKGEEILSMHPQFAEVWEKKALALHGLGRKKEALEAMREAEGRR